MHAKINHFNRVAGFIEYARPSHLLIKKPLHQVLFPIVHARRYFIKLLID